MLHTQKKEEKKRKEKKIQSENSTPQPAAQQLKSNPEITLVAI